jgi:hypothetical protein
MAIDLQVSLVNRNNDEARRNDHTWLRRSYTSEWEATLTLATGVRTQIQPGFDDIQFVYIRVVSLLDVYVYKNRSPEYWSFDRVFVAFETDIDQLSLMAPSEATVYVYVAGE